jgi:hypothetical protein
MAMPAIHFIDDYAAASPSNASSSQTVATRVEVSGGVAFNERHHPAGGVETQARWFGGAPAGIDGDDGGGGGGSQGDGDGRRPKKVSSKKKKKKKKRSSKKKGKAKKSKSHQTTAAGGGDDEDIDALFGGFGDSGDETGGGGGGGGGGRSGPTIITDHVPKPTLSANSGSGGGSGGAGAGSGKGGGGGGGGGSGGDFEQQQRLLFSDEASLPPAPFDCRLVDIAVCWRLFSGSDWGALRHPSGIPAAASSSSSSSTSSSAAARHDDGDEPTGRLTDSMMEVRLRRVDVRMCTYDVTDVIAARQLYSIGEIEILDEIDTSPFRKFLCFYQTRSGREMLSAQLRFDSTAVRPALAAVPVGVGGDGVGGGGGDPLREEVRAELHIAPMRLNIDQDAVEFFGSFFGGGGDADDLAPGKTSGSAGRGKGDTTGVDGKGASGKKKGDAGGNNDVVVNTASDDGFVVDEDDVYVQSFKTTTIRLCVDYAPKRVDYAGLQNGDFVQIMNVFPLEAVELDLKGCALTGVRGWAAVFAEMAALWADDVAKTQAHRYLSGVQPIRSFVNVGAAVADLVVIPITQYRRDGRLARGLRKGAASFVKSIAMETMNVTTRLALGAQSMLETMDHILTAASTASSTTGRRRKSGSAGGRARPHTKRHRRGERQRRETHARLLKLAHGRRPEGHSRLAHQPRHYRDGLRQAYQSLSRGFQTAAHGMVVIPREDYHRYGAKTAVKSLLKAVPGGFIRPMIGATEAVSKALLGVQNSVNPKGKQDADERYK